MIMFCVRLKKFLIYIVFFGLSLMGVSQAGAAGQSEPYIALVGGMLLDGNETPPTHFATVLIKGNKIVAVGPRDEIKLPSGTHVIDARGCTVMPGMVDLHSHVEGIGHANYIRYVEYLGGKANISNNVTPLREIGYKQLLRSGVTSILSINSFDSVLESKRRVESGAIPGPRVAVSLKAILGQEYEKVEPNIFGLSVYIKGVEEARRIVNEELDRGSEHIKVREGLNQEEHNAIVEAAHKRGVKVHAHLSDPKQLWYAVNAGVDTVHHLRWVNESQYDEALIREIVRKKIGFMITYAHQTSLYSIMKAFPERMEDPALLQDMPNDVYKEVANSVEVVLSKPPSAWRRFRAATEPVTSMGELLQAGVTIGVGTGSGTPLMFHTDAMWRELSALVDSGMSPAQVISSATKEGARMIGIDDKVGTIEPGKLADIILVGGDPLSDIKLLRNIELVVKDGVPWYTEKQATDMLRKIGRQF